MSDISHFVLVPGAWLGGWAFEEVTPLLEAAGHDATALTLSGLAEKSDMAVEQIGLQTHVDDILEALARVDDPRRIVLVGHSYSGIPVGQAASRFDGRLRRVVYIDSNVANEGQSFADFGPEEMGAQVRSTIDDNDGYFPPFNATDFEGQDLSPAAIDSIVARLTPHPGKTLTDPAHLERPLADIPSAYIKCLMDWPELFPDVKVLLESPEWELIERKTGHWPMFSQPRQLAQILLDLA